MFVSMQILQLNNYAEFDLIAHGKREKGGDSESMHLQVCNKQYLLLKPDPPPHPTITSRIFQSVNKENTKFYSSNQNASN